MNIQQKINRLVQATVARKMVNCSACQCGVVYGMRTGVLYINGFSLFRFRESSLLNAPAVFHGGSAQPLLVLVGWKWEEYRWPDGNDGDVLDCVEVHA